MGRRRKQRIIGGAGSLVSATWGLYSFVTTAAQLPSDATQLAKLLADPPLELPWIAFAGFVSVLAWALWHHEAPPEDTSSVTASTSGQSSPAIGINHGTVNIGPPNPAAIQPPRSPYGSGKNPYTDDTLDGLARVLRRAGEPTYNTPIDYIQPGLARFVKSPPKRDAGLAEAIAYAELGEWGRQFIDAAGASLNEVPAHLERFRQLAHDGDLFVWGKRSEGGVFERIDQDHWIPYNVEWFDLLREMPRTEDGLGQREGGFLNLMVSKEQFETHWPVRELPELPAKERLPDSPITVSEHLFCESTRVIDEDGEEWADLEAVTIYLQVTNTKTDGTTIKGLRASLRSAFDKHHLPIRNGVSDLRHGEVELIELGTVIATPKPGTGFAPPVNKPPFAIHKSLGEYLRRGGDQRSLRLAGDPMHNLGSGVPFYVVVTAEDTVARAVRLTSDFSLPHVSGWLRQEPEDG